MVASIRKLSVAKKRDNSPDKMSVASLVNYYVDETSLNYYTQGGEPPGEWIGQGAMHLGLTGQVTKEQLFNILMGKSPDGTKQLVRIQKRQPPKQVGSIKEPEHHEQLSSSTQVELPKDQTSNAQNEQTEVKKPKEREEHVPGFDVTFSVPKSVSVLWAMSSPEVRQTIELAIQRAVDSALRTTENQLPLVRRGKAGAIWERGRMIVAKFEHHTARNENDPQLHIHALIANMMIANDGRVFKLNSKSLYPWIRTLGPLFRNNLAFELNDRLGVDLYHSEKKPGVRSGWFEIKGVHKKLLGLFSTRHKEIAEAVELWGTRHSDVKAKEAANLRTRKHKGESIPTGGLFQKWQKQAQSLGIKPESLQSALGKKVSHDREKRFAQAFEYATHKLTISDAAFLRRDLIREVSEQMQDVPIRGDDLIRAIDHTIAHSKDLKTVASRGDLTYYTTKEMWRLEQENAQMVDKLASTPGLAVKPKNIEKALKMNPQLSEEQVKAVREILTNEGSLACMSGIAGSGKSTAMKAIVNAYELEGRNVLGLSLAGAAAQNLQEKTGAECTTVARFLWHAEKTIPQLLKDVVKSTFGIYESALRGFPDQPERAAIPRIDSNTVVIPDEVAMFDTPLGHRLLKQVTDAGAKMVAAGDSEQLPPIGAGNCFQQMTERVGTSFLAENRRQTKIEAEASQLLRDGQIDKALKIYADKGDLTVHENRKEAASAIVKDWSKDGHSKSPEKAMIFVQTREEVRALNRMCQQDRLLSGDMSSKHVKVGTEKVHVGEWIKFNAADRYRGIENSHTGVVTKITLGGEVHVKLDREFTKDEKRRGLKKEIVIKPKQLKARKGEKEPFIMPAYARTVHAGQGLSTEYAYFMPGGRMTNKNLTYVGISRSEVRTKIYVDQGHAGPFCSLITEAMKKQVSKETAHELKDRLSLKL